MFSRALASVSSELEFQGAYFRLNDTFDTENLPQKYKFSDLYHPLFENLCNRYEDISQSPIFFYPWSHMLECAH